MKIAFLNVMSGMNISKEPWQYYQHWKLFMPHSSDILSEVAKEALDADILACAEIDGGSFRTRGVDQITLIAREGGFPYFHFFPTYKIGRFINQGNSIHSRIPLHAIENFLLPGKGEPRFISGTKVKTDAGIINVYVTHLSLRARFRKLQIDELADFMNKIDGPVILFGDFNVASNIEFEILEKSKLTRAITAPTFPSWNPKDHLDCIFVTKHFSILRVWTVQKRFSDHLMLRAELTNNVI